MIYKIEFEPVRGAWTVQIQYWWFFWQHCREDGEILRFATHTKALDWVNGVGLGEVYRNHADRPAYWYIPPAADTVRVASVAEVAVTNTSPVWVCPPSKP